MNKTNTADYAIFFAILMGISLAALLLGLSGCATTTNTPQPAPIVDVPAQVTAPPVHMVPVPPDPYTNLPLEVRDTMQNGGDAPVRDGIISWFPYNEAVEPTIRTAVNHTSEVMFEPGETVIKDGLAGGDNATWSVAGVDNHVLIKPRIPSLNSDLVVITNERSYHFGLVTRNPYMPEVRFFFPERIRAAQAARIAAMRQNLVAAVQANQHTPAPLNFSYVISGANPSWRPVTVFDDGAHAYIEMPEKMFGADAPVLHIGPDKAIANYVVRDNYMIVDRQFNEATLTTGTGDRQQLVTITRR